jgi:predicted transposase YdaD
MVPFILFFCIGKKIWYCLPRLSYSIYIYRGRDRERETKSTFLEEEEEKKNGVIVREEKRERGRARGGMRDRKVGRERGNASLKALFARTMARNNDK